MEAYEKMDYSVESKCYEIDSQRISRYVIGMNKILVMMITLTLF